MRLTNVAHLGLPRGRLSSYAVEVVGRGDALPVSFDQARHVGEGERPGSWMSVAFRMPSSVPSADLARAWDRVVQRHTTLRSVFTRSSDGPVELHEVEVGPGAWVEHEVPADRLTREVLREVLDATCTPYGAPSHRLCLLEPVGERPVVVIASDHAHVDMWSLLVLVRDLLASLGSDEPVSPLPLGFEAHTTELRGWRSAPEEVRTRWSDLIEAGGGVMPRFPLPLGDLSTLRPEVVEVRDVLDAAQVTRLGEYAASQGVRMISIVVSAMTRVHADLAGEPLRAVFPVHSRYDERWHDSVGWFITNSILDVEDPDPRASARSVKEAMSLGSWPLADVLAEHGGMPTAPGMFAISWLDLARLPVATEAGLDAQFVGAVTRTDGVMVWFILNQDGMHLRCRYPDTPQARSSLTRWLDRLEALLGQWGTSPVP